MPEVEINSIEEAKQKVAFLIAELIATDIKEIHIKNGSVDTGQLLQSIKVVKEANGARITIPVPYAEDIEYGNIPHPELDYKTILDWSTRKSIVPPKEQKAFAFFVTNNIRKNGIQPAPFIRPGIIKAIAKLSD